MCINVFSTFSRAPCINLKSFRSSSSSPVHLDELVNVLNGRTLCSFGILSAHLSAGLVNVGSACSCKCQYDCLPCRAYRVVPFRESKLTRLFQSYFCGKGRAAMFVNVSPAASSFDENLQALKFSAIGRYYTYEINVDICERVTTT